MREARLQDLVPLLAHATEEQLRSIERFLAGEPLATPEAGSVPATGLPSPHCTGPGSAPGTSVPRAAAEACDLRPVLTEILRQIRAVAQGTYDLRQENGQLRNAKARLEQIVAEGLLKFLGRVDAQSLRVAYAVLAKGDLAKAARELKVKDSTLRDLVGKWKGMGKDYAVLADLVRWRKDTKFKGTVPLNEAVLAAEPNTVDYRALIEDVLDGLMMMTEGNWEEKREELADLLRPVAG